MQFNIPPATGFTGSDTFQYTVTDGNGGFDTATVNVNVTPTTDLFNVVVAMDISGSMSSIVPGSGGKSHLELTVEALQNLVSQYQALGDSVDFTLITFDDTVTTYNFNTNDFQGILNRLMVIENTPVFGGTNIADTLDEAETTFSTLADTSPTVHNLFYFLSDGVPSPGSTLHDANVDWDTYIDENGIESHAYGFNTALITAMDLIDNTGGAELLPTPEDLTVEFSGILNSRDIVSGTNANNTLNGGVGGDSLFAKAGNDTLIYDQHDPIINGGSGTDTVFVTSASTIDLSDGRLQSIERMNLTNGSTDKLDLSLSDVLNLSDDNTLTIFGDSGDEINASGFTARGANTQISGTHYATFNDVGGNATIYVELGLELNGSTVN